MKVQIALSHLIPSVGGWCRFAWSNPRGAISLLNLRLRYAFLREMCGSWQDRDGFLVDSPETLISYWAIVVERELCHSSWVNGIQQARSPAVIDVGANAGVFAHFIRTLNGKARILAVEPQVCLCERISRYAKACGADIRCAAVACSDHTGIATFFLNHDGDTGASVMPDFGGTYSRSLKVPVAMLDDITPAGVIDLLKIDAEGHEQEVLRGACELLKRTKHLLVEIHHSAGLPAVQELLGAGWTTARLGVIDYLFSNKNLAV